MTRLAELTGNRELVINLTLRELRGKYKRSTLGWGWSLLNPLLSVGIYWLVFGVFLEVVPPIGRPSGLQSFVLFLLCGLIPWNFLSSAMTFAPEILVSNGNLIKKVYFPREILVFSQICALLITSLIEFGVVCVLLLLAGNMVVPWIPMILLVIAIEAVMAVGIALLLSSLNVYFRDVKHFVTIGLQALFYSVPIVYPIRLVPVRAEIFGIDVPVRRIYELNPLVRMVAVFRDVLYNLRFPNIWDLGYFALWAIGLCAFGWFVFHKLEPRLAEEV